jgi:hypothetical protein
MNMEPGVSWTEDVDWRLKHAADVAAEKPAWRSFGRWCENILEGKRKQGLQELKTFLRSFEEWNFSDRQAFVRWYFMDCWTGSILFAEKMCPQPLKEQALKPTLLEWIDRSKEDADPLVWLAELVVMWPACAQLLERALQINPKHIRTRRVFCSRALGSVAHLAEYLPQHYRGEDPDSDLRFLKLVREHLPDDARTEMEELITALGTFTESTR